MVQRDVGPEREYVQAALGGSVYGRVDAKPLKGVDVDGRAGDESGCDRDAEEYAAQKPPVVRKTLEDQSCDADGYSPMASATFSRWRSASPNANSAALARRE